MPNKYNVNVSEGATGMLVEHAAFLAQVSPDAAERLTASFEKAANSLESTPQRCPLLTGINDSEHSYRFLLFAKKIYYYFSDM